MNDTMAQKIATNLLEKAEAEYEKAQRLEKHLKMLANIGWKDEELYAEYTKSSYRWRILITALREAAQQAGHDDNLINREETE